MTQPPSCGRTTRARFPSFLTGFVLLCAGLFGCSSELEDGNLMVFHLSHSDDVKTLDPANSYDTLSLDVVPNIYETLYEYSYLSENYKLTPLLAADFPSYSPDRTTVTIPIRHGIMFTDDPCFKSTHDKGRELIAQDFVYAFKRLALPSLSSAGWWIFDGNFSGINAFREHLANAQKSEIRKLLDAEVEGIKASDRYTLQLKLLHPYPQLTQVLAMSFTSPVPHEAVEMYGDENHHLTAHPVGTGPFVLKEWTRGRHIILDRNLNYHPDFYPVDGASDFRKRGKLVDAGKLIPFLDRVHIEVIKDPEESWFRFMRGALDFTTIPQERFPEAITQQVNLSPDLEAKGIRLGIEGDTSFHYISINMENKVLGHHKLLRQALSLAIDRDQWIANFSGGMGRKMVSALPPGIPNRPKNLKLKYDYQPAQARLLLKKAGFPAGKGLPIFTLDLRSSDTAARKLGQFFVHQWAEIGVVVHPIYNSFPEFLEKIKKGNFQLAYGGWSLDYPDAANVFQLVYGPYRAPGPNDSGFDNREMNLSYEKIAEMEASPERAALIQKMDEILQEETPWIYGFYPSIYSISQPWVLNFRSNPMILNKYKYLRINKDVKKRYLERR